MMNWKPLFFAAVIGAATSGARAEDKLTAELVGDNEVAGISEAGGVVGDGVGSYQLRPTTGKLSLVTNNGRLYRVETYTEWSATNGVRGRVWEKLWVSGGTYTGWSERLLVAGETISFSRNVIDGDIEQEIQPDGGGFIEWTVAGVNNDLEPAASTGDATTDDNPDDKSLPTVEILEEGEFDGISDRRIEIQTHGDKDSTVTFRDVGYSRVGDDADTGAPGLTVDQKLELEGKAHGDLRYTPRADATPTPLPTATPTTSPTPDPDSTDGF